MRGTRILFTTIVAGTIYCARTAGQTTAARDGRGSLQQEQLKFPRVRTAKQEKDSVMRSMVEAKGLAYPPLAILLRAFKKEGVLELWGANSETGPYVLLKTGFARRPVCWDQNGDSATGKCPKDFTTSIFSTRRAIFS
jgi:hypothetical protein